MFHYVYCIENLVNGKIYVGKHSTKNINDGYMGGGTRIRRAIAKHGLANFRKFIIAELDSSEKALEFEKLLVTEEFISDENTYNLNEGGKGSWHAANNSPDVHEKNKRCAVNLNSKIWSNPEFIKRTSERMRNLHSLGLAHKLTCDWSGRKHRPETREKMKASHVGKHDGEKNSQFGTCWVSHPEMKKSQRVNKGEVEGYLADGWVKGRKMKW